MGPYCIYCDRRCFSCIPENAPAEALQACTKHHADILATCPQGQEHDLEVIGWNYDRIRQEAQKHENTK